MTSCHVYGKKKLYLSLIGEFILLVKVWEESSGECLLQIQLLIALKNFVVALGYQSPLCYNILLPVLQKGIDINSPDELNLLEDSMMVCLYYYYPLLLRDKKAISGGLEKIKAWQTSMLLPGSKVPTLMVGSFVLCLSRYGWEWNWMGLVCVELE